MTKIFLLVVFAFLLFAGGFGLSYSSLPASFPLSSFTTSLRLKIQRETAGSVHLLGKPQRPLNRFLLKIVPSDEIVGVSCCLLRPYLIDYPQLSSVVETLRRCVFSGTRLLRYTLSQQLRLTELISISRRLTPSTWKSDLRISPFPVPPIHLPRRFRSLPLAPPLSHIPAWLCSTPICSLPPVCRHLLCDFSNGKLGLQLLGLSQVGPLVFPSWAFFTYCGPSQITNRPWSDVASQEVNSLMSMNEHNSTSGRGLLSFFVSFVVHEEIDHHSTGLIPALIRIKLHQGIIESYLSDPLPVSLISLPVTTGCETPADHRTYQFAIYVVLAWKMVAKGSSRSWHSSSTLTSLGGSKVNFISVAHRIASDAHGKASLYYPKSDLNAN